MDIGRISSASSRKASPPKRVEVAGYSNADKEFGEVVDDLDKLGEEIGVRIRCQREEIFTKMHRV